MAGKSGTDVEKIMYEVLGRCIEKTLQPHVDKVVNSLIDERLSTLIKAHVQEMLISLDLAKDAMAAAPTRIVNRKEKKEPKKEEPVKAKSITAGVMQDANVEDVLDTLGKDKDTEVEDALKLLI